MTDPEPTPISPGDASQPLEDSAAPAADEAAAAQPGGREVSTTGDQHLLIPPIDIFETGEGLVLRADLPGVSNETLELEIQDNRLTLFGRVAPSVPPDAVAVHREYEVGDFLRRFILSDDVDHERISARMTQGVLEITLPRAPQQEPRRIPVDTD